MRIAIAQVVAPQGIRGEVRALSLTDFPELFEGRDVWLGREALTRTRIVRARPHKNVWLLQLDGIEDRNAAERLRGVELCIDEADLAPLGEDEYYVHDLIGMAVETDAGAAVGEISDVIRTGANDVYVVRSTTGREHLVPAVREFVRVDVPSRKVVITPIPGLLD